MDLQFIALESNTTANLTAPHKGNAIPPANEVLGVIRSCGILPYLIQEGREEEFCEIYDTRRQHELRGDSLAGCASVIRYWTSLCASKHSQCQRSVSPATPTRLIDLGEGDVDGIISLPPQLRVVELSQTSSPKYVAVSHRWPREIQVDSWPMLTCDTYTRWTRGFPSATLPAQFRDACMIARILRIQYVWIDSLCILQGRGGDWHVEAPKMASIYGCAFLTIACVDSTSLKDATAVSRGSFVLGLDADTASGCRPKQRSWLDGRDSFRNVTKRQPQPERQSRNTGTVTVSVPTGRSRTPVREKLINRYPQFDPETPESIYAWLDGTDNFPSRPQGELDTRGWTFQERLLSYRVLNITKKGLFWDCLRLNACDWRPLGFLGDPSPRFRDSDERKIKALLLLDGGGDSPRSPMRRSTDNTATATPAIATISYGSSITRILNLLPRSRPQILNMPAPSQQSAKETNPQPPPLANLHQRSQCYRLWRRLVQDYTARSFTNPADRLIGIQGISHQLSSVLGDKDECILGIWRGDALRELIWFIEPGQVSSENMAVQASETDNNSKRTTSNNNSPSTSSSISTIIKAPSWSWASVSSTHGAIQYRLWHPFIPFEDHRVLEHVRPIAILECMMATQVENTSFTNFTGMVVLTGPLAVLTTDEADQPGCRVLLDPRPRAHGRVRARGSGLGNGREGERLPAPAAAEEEEEEEWPTGHPYPKKNWKSLFRGGELTVMPVLEGGYVESRAARYCLILKPQKQVWRFEQIRDDDHNTFRRVGIFVVDMALTTRLCLDEPDSCRRESCRPSVVRVESGTPSIGGVAKSSSLELPPRCKGRLRTVCIV